MQPLAVTSPYESLNLTIVDCKYYRPYKSHSEMERLNLTIVDCKYGTGDFC